MADFDLKEKLAKSKKRVRHEVEDQRVEDETQLKRQRTDVKSSVYKSIFGEETPSDLTKFHGDFMTRCAKMGLR